MECLDIKSNIKTDNLREELVREGKLAGRIDFAYRDELKSRIEYWDGLAWRKEVTKVNHRKDAIVH